MPFDLAESFILEAENALAASLPSSYRKSMLQSNGGAIEAEGDIWELHPIADTSDRKRLSRTSNHVIKETEGFLGWQRFPRNGLSIASNGSGDSLVLLRQESRYGPEVFAWQHETGELIKLADDFSELQKA